MKTKDIENSIDTILKTESIKYVVAAAIGIITFLGLRLVEEVVRAYNLANLPGISNKILVLLSLLLGTLFLLSLFLAYRFYRKTYVKPPSGGYTFFPDPGYYIHNKNKGHYCNPCLAKGYASRLSIHAEDGLKCRLCGEIYISASSETAAFVQYAKNNP
jgi:hypothetical protein